MGLDAAFICSKSATLKIGHLSPIFNVLDRFSHAWDVA